MPTLLTKAWNTAGSKCPVLHSAILRRELRPISLLALAAALLYTAIILGVLLSTGGIALI